MTVQARSAMLRRARRFNAYLSKGDLLRLPLTSCISSYQISTIILSAAVAHLLWPQLGLAHLLEPVLKWQAVQHCLVHLDEEAAVFIPSMVPNSSTLPSRVFLRTGCSALENLFVGGVLVSSFRMCSSFLLLSILRL